MILRYRARHTEIGNFRSFFPLLPPKNPKNQDFKKCKNLLEISFYTCVPKITIIWRMVPEIWSATDRKSKFWKNEKSTWRYYHFTNVYHKWQSYDIWFFRYGVQQTKSFVILDRFLPFHPCNSPKNQNFEKMKKNT